MKQRGMSVGENAAGGRACRIEPFPYASMGAPHVPDWAAWAGAAGQSGSLAQDVAKRDGDGSLPPHFELELAEQKTRSFHAGREKGVEEGRSIEREAMAAAVHVSHQQRSTQLARLIESFAEARDRYMHAVEQEVIRLSLAIASRILRREAQMDPLFLTGAVRVALGQLAASTTVRLRVPVADVDLWKDSIALLPNLVLRPEIVPSHEMRLGDCVLEAQLGSVDLGVRAQLGEIEGVLLGRSRHSSAAPEPTPSTVEMA